MSLGMRLEKRFVVRLVAVLAVLALLATACGDDDDGGSGAELRSIELGLSGGSLAFYGFFAADSLGYYEDEGLDVNITPTEGSSDAAQQLVAENFDIAMGVPDAMLAAMQTENLYPFFTYFTSEFRDWVVPVDSPIQAIADLAGLRQGVSTLQSGEVPLVRYLLNEEGIDPQEDIEIIEVGDAPPSIQAALEQERIDSFAGSASHVIAINSAGYETRSILPETFASGLPVEGLLAREPFNEDDELLVGIARATARGILFCQTSIEACIDAIGQDRPELVEDRELAVTTLENYYTFSTPPEENGELNFSPTTTEGWEHYLGVYSSGEDPVVTDPGAIDLPNLVIEDLREAINDFDRDAVIEEANNFGG
ncbi:MAG: PhnD/SsuA/transferrin family substrate-binding protein [Actinobacteria bacterium]|nr:PhnD/SsuA/transferrin family substrate-binding protein [Actinomycetota bacterium]